MSTLADPITAEDALLEVMPIVKSLARRNERYGVEADDISQDALIRLYRAFCRDMPDTASERGKLATTCTVRAALHLHRYATRQARDYRATTSIECVFPRDPSLHRYGDVAIVDATTNRHREWDGGLVDTSDPQDLAETEELIEHTPNPQAVRMRLAGYQWKEIGKKIGNEGRQWRYELQQSLSRTLAAV